MALQNERSPTESLDLAREIVDIASDKQASDIVLLDLRGVSLIADYFVVLTASTQRQITAVQDDVIRQVRKKEGRRPVRQEGVPESGWVLLDYADVVVHLFLPEERDYYRLEEIWAGAVPIVHVQ